MRPPDAPGCPRFGYHLSAPTLGWGESCPLGGRCSECGLEFGWRDVLGPDAMPWWWIEGARGDAMSVTLSPVLVMAAIAVGAPTVLVVVDSPVRTLGVR